MPCGKFILLLGITRGLLTRRLVTILIGLYKRTKWANKKGLIVVDKMGVQRETFYVLE